MRNMDLIGKKKYFFAFSILLTIIGLIGFFVNGVQLDMQFQGGTVIKLEMLNNDYVASDAEKIVNAETGKQVSAQKLQTFGTESTSVYILMVSISSDQALSSSEVNNIVNLLTEKMEVNKDATPEIQYVEPLIGREMLNNGIKAIIWACILMIIYIWYRFRTMAHAGLSAGLTAVMGLVHDAAIMLTVYIVFRIPLNESFIAAILTILGYSINDTIIIYDRIRENTGLMKKTPIAELVNKSILQTLTRSINTVLTVLICIIVIFIFATVNNIQSIKDFSFPLIIGITSGCYSSIFISSPLWVLWKEYQGKKKVVAVKPARSR
jgi:preprotein translocase subunit SecF